MTAAVLRSDSGEHTIKGILWMLATILCFTSLDTTMKYLLQSLPLVQVTWARFFFATVIAVIICGRRLPELAISRVPKLQLLRSFLLMATTGVFNYGIETTPLATAATISFTSPLLVVVLSGPLLRERVSLRQWLGVAVGFLGALVVVRPWQESLTQISGVLVLLLAALFNSNYQIATRQVRGDDPLTSLLYTATAGALVTSVLLPWWWIRPQGLEWAFLGGAGILGGLGHYCLIRAMTLAPASVVAPFSYTSLIWATIFGFVLWGDWPSGYTWTGAALIIGSGLYIFYGENRQGETAR